MKILRYVFAVLIAALPTLWIDDYNVTNPIWWTVVLAWHLGTEFGILYKED